MMVSWNTVDNTPLEAEYSRKRIREVECLRSKHRDASISHSEIEARKVSRTYGATDRSTTQGRALFRVPNRSQGDRSEKSGQPQHHAKE